MAAAEVLEDDRDTSLPSSALSPAEYRGFRALVNDLDQIGVVDNGQVSVHSVLEFLSSFSGVNQSVAQQVLDYSSPNTKILGRGNRASHGTTGICWGRTYLCHDPVDRALAG